MKCEKECVLGTLSKVHAIGSGHWCGYVGFIH